MFKCAFIKAKAKKDNNFKFRFQRPIFAGFMHKRPGGAGPHGKTIFIVQSESTSLSYRGYRGWGYYSGMYTWQSRAEECFSTDFYRSSLTTSDSQMNSDIWGDCQGNMYVDNSEYCDVVHRKPRPTRGLPCCTCFCFFWGCCYAESTELERICKWRITVLTFVSAPKCCFNLENIKKYIIKSKSAEKCSQSVTIFCNLINILNNNQKWNKKMHVKCNVLCLWKLGLYYMIHF